METRLQLRRDTLMTYLYPKPVCTMGAAIVPC